VLRAGSHPASLIQLPEFGERPWEEKKGTGYFFSLFREMMWTLPGRPFGTFIKL